MTPTSCQPRPVSAWADLDAFAGSGATLIAAERTGRRSRAIEIDPVYTDLCVRRLETETETRAQLADGSEFREVAKARLGIEKAVRNYPPPSNVVQVLMVFRIA